MADLSSILAALMQARSGSGARGLMMPVADRLGSAGWLTQPVTSAGPISYPSVSRTAINKRIQEISKAVPLEPMDTFDQRLRDYIRLSTGKGYW